MKSRILKLTLVAVTIVGLGLPSKAQVTRDLTEIDESNSWLKAGLNLGIPAGRIADSHIATLSLDLSGQFMRTNRFGLGITSGYSHFFTNGDEQNMDDFGIIPLQLMGRYYPDSSGFFAGVDAGYTFTVSTFIQGGPSIRPHVGYHNYDWNFFAFVNNIWSDNWAQVTTIGIGATYNVRFN